MANSAYRLGISGYSGFSGKSGFSGLNGSNGISGLSGFSGYSGLNGSGTGNSNRIVNVKTSGYQVVSGDLNKVISMNAAGEYTITLLNASGNIGFYLTIAKQASGNLNIYTGNSGIKINDSVSGLLINNLTNETYANVTLLALNENQWIVTGGTGTWESV